MRRWCQPWQMSVLDLGFTTETMSLTLVNCSAAAMYCYWFQGVIFGPHSLILCNNRRAAAHFIVTIACFSELNTWKLSFTSLRCYNSTNQDKVSFCNNNDLGLRLNLTKTCIWVQVLYDIIWWYGCCSRLRGDLNCDVV